MKTFIIRVLLLTAVSMITIICVLQTDHAYGITKPSEKVHMERVYISMINQHVLASRLAPPPSEETDINSVISYALKFIGTRYTYGASGPNAFDCSGFTMHVMSILDINLPHTARGQYTMGTEVKRDDLIPGDLVFFATSGKIKVSHVGIYIGDNCFIHASLDGVMINCLDEGYYRKRYTAAVRVIQNKTGFI